MDRPQLIEKRKREARDLFGVLRIIIEAAREPARAGKQFGGAAFFFFRSDAHGILFRDQIQQDSFADAHAGDEHGAEVEPFRKRSENNRGDADDLGAVFANAEDAHAAGNIQSQHAPGLVAQQARIDRGDAFDHRARAMRTSASAFPPQATAIERLKFGGEGIALRSSERMW